MNYKELVCSIIFAISLTVLISQAFADGPISEINIPACLNCANHNNNQTNNQTNAQTNWKNKFQLNITHDNGQSSHANIFILDNQTNGVLNNSFIDGIGYVSANSQKVNLLMDFDDYDVNITFKNLDMNYLNSTTADFFIDDANPSIDGIIIYKAFHVRLPSKFLYNTIELKISYDGFNLLNESNLVIYKCSNYDIQADECNGDWIKYTPSRNSANKFVSLEVSGFSTYALGESDGSGSTTTSTTTTTNTTSTTTTAPATTTISQSNSGGGGSGGGSSNGSSSTTESATTIEESTSSAVEDLSAVQNETTNQTSGAITSFASLTGGYSLLYALPLVAVPCALVFYKFRDKIQMPSRSIFIKPKNSRRKKPKHSGIVLSM